jgi:RNA polymerase sigma-70 factor (ECF subfamily)
MSLELTSTTNAIAISPCWDALTGRGEEVLLDRARNGNSSAFEALVVPHRGQILRIAQRMLHNWEDAEDVVQITLLQAFRHLDDFQGHSRFSSWLVRIAVNAALMRLRTARRKRETSIDEMLNGDDSLPRLQVADLRLNPEENYLAKERPTVLMEAISHLGSRNKIVFDLRHIQELPFRETAQALGISISMAKARSHRARVKVIQSVQAIVASKAVQSAVKNRNRMQSKTAGMTA